MKLKPINIMNDDAIQLNGYSFFRRAKDLLPHFVEGKQCSNRIVSKRTH